TPSHARKMQARIVGNGRGPQKTATWTYSPGPLIPARAMLPTQGAKGLSQGFECRNGCYDSCPPVRISMGTGGDLGVDEYVEVLGGFQPSVFFQRHSCSLHHRLIQIVG